MTLLIALVGVLLENAFQVKLGNKEFRENETK